MSIKKRVQGSLLFVSIASIAALMLLCLFGLFNIRSGLNSQMEITSETISSNNTHDMLAMSEQLAESIARQDARNLNGDFMRIKGELLTLKGDIENLYQGEGLQITPAGIQRHEEYIVSQAATLSQQEIDDTVQILSGVTAMFDNVLAQEDKISLAYIVLENGMVFSSSDTFYPEVEKADMRTRDWYKGAVMAGGLHWAELYSGTDGRSYITVAVPVYREGQVWGVVAFDLRVSEISDVVLAQENATFTDAFIMSDSGAVLLSTQDTAETAASDVYLAITAQKDIFTTDSGCYQGANIIAGYSTIEETGWKLVSLLDYDQMLEPVRKIEATVSSASSAMQTTMMNQIYTIILCFVLFFSALLSVTVLVSRKLAKRITHPLMELNEGVKVVAGGKLDYFIDIHTGDEIETLAKSFNQMTGDLLNQMINLKRVTAEKERIGAELSVATNIQASMLPCIFPAFPGRPEFDIFADMHPAKEVGGDFYDFFMTDDDHLWLVMADVSGKGVPAALFMVIAKTLLKNHAGFKDSPADVLEVVNNQLCETNEAGMFVTTFMGRLELSTGIFAFANAGHNFPLLCRAGQSYDWMKTKPNFVLAGMEGMIYQEHQVELKPGDRLFLYTDGVTEALDPNQVLYSDERLIDTLNGPDAQGLSLSQLVNFIKHDITTFADGAEQADDITMLSLELRQ